LSKCNVLLHVDLSNSHNIKVPIIFIINRKMRIDMKLVCMHCGKSFEGNKDKFCSQGCRDSHILAIEYRLKKAMEDNKSHTDKMSK